jgi:hypothetical protein
LLQTREALKPAVVIEEKEEEITHESNEWGKSIATKTNRQTDRQTGRQT